MACRLEVQHEIFDRSSSVSHTVQRQISDGSSLSVNHPVQRQISDGSSLSVNHPVQRQITDGSSSSVNHPVQRQISDGSSSSVSHPVQRQISEGSSISVQQPVQRQISEGASLSVKQPVQKSSACVHPTPPKESPKELPSKAVWVQTCSSLTSDVDGTNLCLPSKTGTLVATVVTSSFAAMGLLCMGFSELGLPGATMPGSKSLSLWLRCSLVSLNPAAVTNLSHLFQWMEILFLKSLGAKGFKKMVLQILLWHACSMSLFTYLLHVTACVNFAFHCCALC
eukprot:Skav235986  [mRNA]  locus=scaffold592:495402:496244:- [translate_table: standard]